MSVRPGHALDRWELGPVHSLDLLRSALDDDGCQHLGQADQARFQATYDDGDEGAFCRIAKPRALVAYLDEFLGYFLVRKVMLRGDQVAEVVEHVRAFVAWLRDEGRSPRRPPATPSARWPRRRSTFPPPSG